MRVIAGQYKRRLLQSLPGNDLTRPTSDRVKESIFNIISGDIADTVVLDLFAGSGSLGIESLSRGAKKAIFVEQNFDVAKNIQLNLDNLKINENDYILIKSDVSKFLSSNTLNSKVDIIFADPPYRSEWYAQALEEIEKSNICNENCTVIFEMPTNRKIQLQCNSEGWLKEDERQYGKTKIEIWRKGLKE
ncbi:16S rRNA (guanine(966)-N(2))-methyltransferase RsmD [Silvanigrella aquatica]|uniref:16S rRNA (Guanine(966)-N(2))-methyltransferase RsmD n=1 Tax=Silvanigrella aquatica TaxID=1915309 RepID=A0A1L4CY93_9BACT|nr:16S rRNA (guanine(966)-N(2))-methyltransferase RsmD [Silvanigrella aquatica]APJ02905.1 16S rRNA (guanine(966)-N(2))-methyltransferase RsmD [Silvanigrella aquatica]